MVAMVTSYFIVGYILTCKEYEKYVTDFVRLHNMLRIDVQHLLAAR